MLLFVMKILRWIPHRSAVVEESGVVFPPLIVACLEGFVAGEGKLEKGGGMFILTEWEQGDHLIAYMIWPIISSGSQNSERGCWEER